VGAHAGAPLQEIAFWPRIGIRRSTHGPNFRKPREARAGFERVINAYPQVE
jgi:hypothetical protein